ncbi:DUF2800 domain-containing protein [Eubacteriales bacterium OttesenSCG-928-A19]|nr:DUF2800 domain-containing protein [Eubacteriales bacterium OttesenSCG-928-A19]
MSAHALLSPSAAERWLNCTPAPRLEAELPETTSSYAEEGTLAHEVCDLFARKKFTLMKLTTYKAALKKLKANPLWQDEMTTTATTYVEHLTENSMKFEHAPYMAFEVKVDISDFVPEAFGRCDCVMIGGDELIITDYKHGKGVPVSPEGNPQMMLYALGALKLYRPIYGDAIQRVTMYIDQPRLDSYSGYTLSVDDLLAWGENTVKPKAAIAHMGLGDFNPGDWCRFCRAKGQCRARAGAHTALEDFANTKMIPDENAHKLHELCVPGTVEPLLTDDEVGDLLTRGKALVDWYNALEEYALTTLLNGGTIAGHKVVEGTSKTTFAPDYDTAAAVLVAAGFKKATLYRQTPETLTNLDKLVGGRPKLKELLGDHLYKPPGKPALAPESDKRPPYNPAAADFSEV